MPRTRRLLVPSRRLEPVAPVMRVVPIKKPTVEARTPIRMIWESAVAANHYGGTAAGRKENRRRNYRRRRQRGQGQAEWIEQHRESSRLRRHASRTHANRYQTEQN